MANFMIRFLLCNVFISGIIGILLIAKWVFRNNLSSRMQYNMWLLLLGLLAVPFMPFRLVSFPQIFSWLSSVRNSSASHTDVGANNVMDTGLSGTTNWMNDFAISVNHDTSSVTGYILLSIWIVGMLVMMILVIKSSLRLRTIKRSALPLQNPKVRRLYNKCLNEMKITRNIPVYSTAFLKSPIIVGFLKPCIYLPIHLISDYHESDMRYMLLHELQHYRHKDAIANYLMNFAGVLYWFNPFVWFALREMRNDREVALKGMTAFILTTVLIMGLTPFISTYAADESRYQWKSSSENISYVDFSKYFGKYEGSFVLYDLRNDVWSIHDIEHATLRVAPDSTYKIYDALFGLEEGVITPQDSFIAWNGENYPFEAWNADQTLQSAMASSVNWYFQSVDEQLGTTSVYDYIKEIGYGNKNMSGDFSTYWMESSLKISPIEQVELLTQLQNNNFGFAPENINAVKDSICLSSSDAGTFYGKTGTGRVDGQDVNGWFIGYIETADNTYFFATNIGADSDATGGNATEITMSILSDMNIWK